MYSTPPINSNELPTAVAANQAPCITPCMCGGATFETKANPNGLINNSATVRIKYSPTIIQGVTNMLLTSSALMPANASLLGKAKENNIRNT